MRQDIGQVDIRLPIGVDRADIAPIGLLLMLRADAACRETVRHRPAMLDDIGDEIAAEIVLRGFVGGILAQQIGEEFGAENIDAHRGEGEFGIAGDARRIGGLFDEGDDAIHLVDMHHAEAGRLAPRHFEAADRDIRT